MFARSIIVGMLGSAVALVLSSCATVPYQPYAREVAKKPNTGGVIALKAEHRDEDRTKAMDLIQRNCGANTFEIKEEGETVVGQSTTSNANQTHQAGNQQQVGTFLGMPVTSGTAPTTATNATATTTELKEWRITYECMKPVATATTEKTTTRKSKK
jgi:hypothetical protein